MQLFDPSIPLFWRRVAVGILAAWTVVAIPMAIYAPKLINLTTLNMSPPDGSDSQHAYNEMHRDFPAFASMTQFAIVVGGGDVWPNNELVGNYTQYVDDDMAAYKKAHPDEWPDGVAFCAAGVYGGGCDGYDYLFPKLLQEPLHATFVAPSRDLTFIMMLFTDPTGKSDLSVFTASFLSNYAKHVLDDVVPMFDKMKADHPDGAELTARATGPIMLSQDAITGSIKDLEHSDLVVMPIAFIILTYYVRSIRLLIVALMTLGLSIGCSFLLVYPLARYTSLTFLTFVPQFMMSSCLAVSLDYNLFILTRFKEGVDAKLPMFEVLRQVVTHTCGHTIAISGTLITVAWLGLCVIPCEPLITQGLSTAIAAVSIIVVNVTVSPALLAVFPSFFKVRTSLPDCVKRRLLRVRRACCGAGAGDARCGYLDLDAPVNNDNEGAEPSSDVASGGPHTPHVARAGAGARLERGSVAGGSSGVNMHFAEASWPLTGSGSGGRGGGGGGSSPIGTDDEKVLAQERQAKDIWFRIAKVVQGHYWLVMLAVVAAGAPLYSRVPEVETSIDPFEMTPRNAPSVKAWQEMSESFPPGSLLPYYVVVSFQRKAEGGRWEGYLNSSVGYEMMRDVLETTVVATNLQNYVTNDSVSGLLTGVAQLPRSNYTELCAPPNQEPGVEWDGAVTWEYLYSAKHGLFVPGSDFNPLMAGICRDAYSVLRGAMMTKEHTATFSALLTPYQPLGQLGAAFMSSFDGVRDSLELKWSRPGNATRDAWACRVYLAGGNTVSRDYNSIINKWTIPALLGIIGLVMAVILFSFRSVVIPLRMAVTITYTVATTLGFAYYVYQTSAFHWLFPFLKDFKGDAFYFLVPTCAIAITACLGMDYDVFLITRIHEYRFRLGYTTQAAITKGLTKTGPIITGAGVIMTVAFFGLILSNVVAMNQFGVLLCFSVLLDTFVVRLLFVPATMYVMDEWSWWPKRPEPGVFEENDFVDEFPACAAPQ